MLCELLTLKKRLGIAEADVVDDDLLTSFINALSGRLAKECNRTFDYSATATYDFRADEFNVVVDRYPIVTVTSFSLKETETDGWVVQTTPDYLINETRSIIELSSPLGNSRQLGRVTFAGGYVLPGGTVGAGQTALPSELAQACVEQCSYWYQRRNELGLTSVGGTSGSIGNPDKPLALLPQVMAVVRKYERWRN